MPDDVRVTGLRKVGTRPVRPDGVDKVTGRAKFGADFNMPNQLVGQVLPPSRPRHHQVDRYVEGQGAERRQKPSSPGTISRICPLNWPRPAK